MPHTDSPSHPPISRPAGRLAQLSGEPAALFAYGTLRFPDVMRALLDRLPDSAEVAVAGWRAAALPGRVYPALVAAPGLITGSLVTGLSSDDWRILDAFEDEVYDLRRLDTGCGQHGWAYVCPDDSEVLPHDWDAAEFERHELAAYVLRCQRWRDRVRAGTERVTRATRVRLA